MTKLILRIVVLFLATICLNSAYAQQQSFIGINPPTSHLLRCRGPLQYVVGPTTVSPMSTIVSPMPATIMFFAKNPSAAGDSGISLQPGTCAWNDRPVASDEPGKVWFTLLTRAGVDALIVRPIFTAFTSCAGSSRCVVEFGAVNANYPNDPYFIADGSYIRIYYPAFP